MRKVTSDEFLNSKDLTYVIELYSDIVNQLGYSILDIVRCEEGVYLTFMDDNGNLTSYIHYMMDGSEGYHSVKGSDLAEICRDLDYLSVNFTLGKIRRF